MNRSVPPGLLRLLAATSLMTLMGAAACSSSSSGSGSSCNAGAERACTCASGVEGTETCDGSGVYGACVCPGGGADAGGMANDASSVDAQAAPDGDTHCSGCGDGGGLADVQALDAAPGTFGAHCSMASDCTSMDCSNFPAKGGGFCTVPCSTAADCPPQALGCNGMGQCKVP